MNVRHWSRLRDWLLLVCLLGVSSTVMLLNNSNILITFRAAALQFTSRVESSVSWFGRYLGALNENESLRRQNIALSSQLARSREAQLENERLLNLLDFTQKSQHDLLPSRIISKQITWQQNSFVIDRGAQDGVEIGMGVVNDLGILGKVTDVSGSYARVMSYLNTDFRLPAKIQPHQSMGIVTWEGVRKDELLMEHVIRTEPVEVNQTVVTSEYSGVYPNGYPIGVIQEVITQPGKNHFLISVRPLANYENAEHAFVIFPPDSMNIPEITLTP